MKEGKHSETFDQAVCQLLRDLESKGIVEIGAGSGRCRALESRRARLPPSAQ